MDRIGLLDLPRITIVMPSLNQSKFIEEAILSILEQNYPRLEFMILDGGSTDGSQEIIKRYSDHLAFWQSRGDAGQTDALIQGFSHATGELMGWLNSDDILLPGALNHIARAYISHPEGNIFGGNTLVIDELGDVLRCRRPPSETSRLAKYGWSVVPPASFFTHKVYENVGGLHRDLHYIMDADLFLRMIHNNARFQEVNAWISGFRLQSLSKTVTKGSNFEKEFESIRERYLPWIKLTPKKGRGLYIWIQLFNGNYVKMFMETCSARGMNWKKWCEKNQVIQITPYEDY